LVLPLPSQLYRTKHHPGMAFNAVRTSPEFNYSNRTLGGGQWDANLVNSTAYAIPQGYDYDQLGTDLGTGNVGQLNFVIPDQCDDMHGITVNGSDNGTAGSASDCGGSNIITRGDNYVDNLVKKIQASSLWQNPQRRVAIVVMFDEGTATTGINSCCGWNPSANSNDAPLVQGADGGFSPDPNVPVGYSGGNRGHGNSIFGILTNQPGPKGIKDSDAYSHFSFVRTLQDMFQVSDPAKDGTYINRSKYTEKFIAQNILNLPEYAGSADTHFDSVRPINHAFVIPAGYGSKQLPDILPDGGTTAAGPDSTQTNVWAVK
ncbi:MAG: alkaline phosphatase family protein, partial [Polyangiaceae bacterium]|nr:alkaline phosphatase family protein [Polyangiaceae bacterium]